jgi:hypothetical protein
VNIELKFCSGVSPAANGPTAWPIRYVVGYLEEVGAADGKKRRGWIVVGHVLLAYCL